LTIGGCVEVHKDFLKPALLIVLLVCSPALIKSAKADGWFFLDPIELEAEIRFDGYQYDLKRSSDDADDPAETRSSWLLEERLFMAVSGLPLTRESAISRSS
jgi:hypothetical protein